MVTCVARMEGAREIVCAVSDRSFLLNLWHKQQEKQRAVPISLVIGPGLMSYFCSPLGAAIHAKLWFNFGKLAVKGNINRVTTGY